MNSVSFAAVQVFCEVLSKLSVPLAGEVGYHEASCQNIQRSLFCEQDDTLNAFLHSLIDMILNAQIY